MKWIVLLLVVGGLVLASGPVPAQQGNPPVQSATPCVQELAKYHDLIQKHNALAQVAQQLKNQGGPPPPALRALLKQVLDQGRVVAECKQAVAAGEHTPPPAQ